jgi:hypothetical protein
MFTVGSLFPVVEPGFVKGRSAERSIPRRRKQLCDTYRERGRFEPVLPRLYAHRPAARRGFFRRPCRVLVAVEAGAEMVSSARLSLLKSGAEQESTPTVEKLEQLLHAIAPGQRIVWHIAA